MSRCFVRKRRAAAGNFSKRVLVLRLSAIGDVAMVAPVLRQYAERCPQVLFTMVSRPFLQPLFEGLPNLIFIGVDVYGSYSGWRGLWKMFRSLRVQKPDVVADVHDVLRTKVLRILFAASGVRVYRIRKGRAEKRAVCRQQHLPKAPLTTTFERYAAVLEKATGVRLEPAMPFHPPAYNQVMVSVKDTAVGIAPFARHRGKIYPPDKMEQVVAHFAINSGLNVVLFGSGGGEEQSYLERWAHRYPNVQSLAGKCSLYDELAVMQRLPVMVTMDSANMHFAAFVDTPVVSVWGATHPYVGFYGWRQLLDNAVSVDLPCRPCSVYGNKPCRRGDYACLRTIKPMDIIQKVEAVLAANRMLNVNLTCDV